MVLLVRDPRLCCCGASPPLFQTPDVQSNLPIRFEKEGAAYPLAYRKSGRLRRFENEARISGF